MNRPKIPVLIKHTKNQNTQYEFTFLPDGDTGSLQSSHDDQKIYEPFFYDTISVNRYVSAKKKDGKDVLIKSLAVEDGKLVAYTLTKEKKDDKTITTIDSKEESPLTDLQGFVCPYADSS